MPSMYISISPKKRRITIEPSFTTLGNPPMLSRIHSVWNSKVYEKLIKVEYTRGFELHETLAAIIFMIARSQEVRVARIKLNGNVKAKPLLSRARTIALMMESGQKLADEINANEKLLKTIKERTEDYDEALRHANFALERAIATRTEAASSPYNMGAAMEFHDRNVAEATEKRRLIMSDHRYDPARKAKAERRLDQLRAEVTAFLPQLRHVVREELRFLIVAK